MTKSKATGKRGSWFADVDGQSLPCVHKHWWKGGRYDDPQIMPGSPKDEELVAAIQQHGRVVLTNDSPYDAGEGKTGFTRTGYIAVYSVDDITFDQKGLRFRFVSRLKELK